MPGVIEFRKALNDIKPTNQKVAEGRKPSGCDQLKLAKRRESSGYHTDTGRLAPFRYLNMTTGRLAPCRSLDMNFVRCRSPQGNDSDH